MWEEIPSSPGWDCLPGRTPLSSWAEYPCVKPPMRKLLSPRQNQEPLSDRHGPGPMNAKPARPSMGC